LGWKLLDGDELRKGINNDLGYDRASKKESALRTAHIAKLFGDCVVSHMSPYAEDRELVKNIIADYVEVYLDCPIDVLKKRDTKGFYVNGNAFVVHELGSPDLAFDTSVDSADYICDRVCRSRGD